MNLHDLRDYILLIAGRMVKWSTVSSLTSNFGGLNATMPPADPALGEKSTTQTCRNMIGFGFRSAPVTGSECIVTAPRAGAVNATIVASDHLGYGPTDLAEGDSVQYSKAHHEGAVCVTKHAATGKITIDSKSDQDVQVNGGTLKVARNTDPTRTGTLSIVNTKAIGPPVVEVFTLTYTDEDGAVTPLWTMTFTAGLLTAAAPTNATFTAILNGRIKDGAARFKA